MIRNVELFMIRKVAVLSPIYQASGEKKQENLILVSEVELNTGPFSQCFIVLPTSNSVISAINRVSTLHLSQVVHVNVVQTQPKVTHKHS